MKKSRPEDIRAKLKSMGLSDSAIASCMATFRASGEERTMQQAQAVVERRQALLLQARLLACKILGQPA